jgi:hypothetical protein
MPLSIHDIFPELVVEEIKSQLASVSQGKEDSVAIILSQIGLETTSDIYLYGFDAVSGKFPKRSPDASLAHADTQYPSIVIHSGRAEIESREIVNFSSFDAPELLSEAFARAITRRWEGFVLKGCDDPYFSFNGTASFIKLKKDYIAGLGDTADFAIVGGRRDARDEQELGIGKL